MATMVSVAEVVMVVVVMGCLVAVWWCWWWWQWQQWLDAGDGNRSGCRSCGDIDGGCSIFKGCGDYGSRVAMVSMVVAVVVGAVVAVALVVGVQVVLINDHNKNNRHPKMNRYLSAKIKSARILRKVLENWELAPLDFLWDKWFYFKYWTFLPKSPPGNEEYVFLSIPLLN